MKKYSFFTTKEIKPRGWLKRQLEIQAEGLSGNLDKMWRDIRDSAWIGGDCDGWERVPYWLDGFIPLAYLLENEDMISRAKKYIDAIIERQQDSGWICPCTEEEIPEYDTWAVQLITKVLVVYYECSGDERIPDVIYKAMKNYYELLMKEKIRLFRWGKHRWFEAFIAINFLKERFPERWIYELAFMMKDYGADYSSFTEEWKTPLNRWAWKTHIVNLAMMLKYEAVSCDALGEKYEDIAEKLRTILDKYNGTAVETFTGDECLSGRSPIQGTELCAVVEQMFSYELLYAYTGDSKWAERLEVIAFNALPATISDDMWTHQYAQLSNQISCERFPAKPIFRTNQSEAHLFGLEPNFGCCTANFNQGWPKFALSTFMYDENSIISAIPVPASVKTDEVEIILDTNYPFETTFTYTIKSKKDFCFDVRVPSFARKVKVNGEYMHQEGKLSFEIKNGDEKEINISYETPIRLIDRPHKLKSVRYGSLVFAVPIKYEKIMYEYEKDGVERKFPYCDYEYVGISCWNYALCSKKFKLIREETDKIPFSSQNPPVKIKAKVKQINWGLADGYTRVCDKFPQSRKPVSKAREIELYPYGSAKLRMTEIPLIK